MGVSEAGVESVWSKDVPDWGTVYVQKYCFALIKKDRLPLVPRPVVHACSLFCFVLFPFLLFAQ